MDPLDEIFARLTMLEFAIEVMMANELSKIDESESDKFKSDFLDAMSRPYAHPTGDLALAERMRIVSEASIRMSERLMEKVESREASVRQIKALRT